MKDLSCNFCGLTLEHPFVLASAPPTASIEMIDRAFAAGWAGAVTKTIKPDTMLIEDVSPRFRALHEGNHIIGFENFELVSKRGLNYWTEGIRALRKKWPEKILIVSLMGDSTPETWKGLALWAEQSGAQALELNFSCPHGMPERGVGAAIGQNAEITKTITGWVKESTSLPVMVKLTPNVTSVPAIAAAALQGGADAFAAINTVESLMGVNLENLTPFPAVGGFSSYGGYSGRGVKPIGLRVIAQLFNHCSVPLSGIGGISTWQDALEYIALGANHVQICTEVMVSGFGIVKGLIAGARQYLKNQGLGSLEEIRGIAARKLTTHQALARERFFTPEVNSKLCTKCGRCLIACRDGAYQAIFAKNREIHIDQSKCDGCGLCSLVCPAQAIRDLQVLKPCV